MDENKVVFREASAGDLHAIMTMYRCLQTEPETEIDGFDPERHFEQMKRYPYHRIFVAEKNGMVIGTFTLTIIEYLCHQDKSAGIMEAVVVDDAFRSQGIGKQMVAFALLQCKDNNCYKMALSSNVIREKAHAFYEREGFSLYGYSLSVDV